METNISHSNLIQRKQHLLVVQEQLKNKFLGLDDVIDEVMRIMMPWYLFPNAQLRPTVINLWGLTGSGKTALVHAIVAMLNHKRFYSHIDMGEFESDSASWMKRILTNDLEFFHEQPALLCLDEFQFARTLDKGGNELGKDKLRVIWELLDSGKIEYIPTHSTFYLFRADNCLKKLERLLHEPIMLKEGIITEGLESFTRVFSGFSFEYEGNASSSNDYFLTDDFVNGMFLLFDEEDYSKEQIRNRVKSADSIAELALFVGEALNKKPATRTLDLSRSLIFVLGNLDEAYSMSHNLNPDISANEFHEATAKITIADIKRALRSRFRPEQIARLGNNHVIYRSFNNAQFRTLIRRELNRIRDFVFGQFGWPIAFDESVVDIVYAEGVFPAQGTRPVLTTVKNLIESNVSSLAVSLLEHQIEIAEIQWKYENGKFSYFVYDKRNALALTLTDNVNLKLEGLRKSIDPEIQAHVAVHEAGHAVLAALTFRIIPSVVVSRTASDMEGFCMVNFPKGPITRDTLKKDIVITLGGYVAEKMIFGEDHTSSGVYSDIEEASALANKAIRNYAMGNDPIHLAIASQNEDAFVVTGKYCKEALQIVKACELEAEIILQRNKLLLLKMAEYLTSHSRMEEFMIETFVREYANERWPSVEGFRKKDNYHNFNTTLKRHLEAIQHEISSKETERILSEVDENEIKLRI